MTAIGSLDFETIFDPAYLKVFELEDSEHLLDMNFTGDFDQIDFVVGRLP